MQLPNILLSTLRKLIQKKPIVYKQNVFILKRADLETKMSGGRWKRGYR